MLSPLVGRATYLRWVCLVLGGALLMPYVMVGSVIGGLIGLPAAPGPLPQPLVFLAVLPLVALTGLVLPVRALEVTAARSLLGAEIAPLPAEWASGRRSWDERRRTATWFTLHLGVGGVMSGLTLATVPFVIVTILLPITGVPFDVWMLSSLWEVWWSGPLLGVALLVALVYLTAGVGVLLARSAPKLLGPSPAQRLALLEERVRRQAVRNGLARELHDSIGHALNVVTVQAGAAARTLDRDPAVARAVLGAIEESARAALEELDQVLGVLREQEDEPSTAPARTLADLSGLVRGTGAAAEVTGDLATVPSEISREVYRIAQESLTNALRHGTGPVRLALVVHDDHLELDVRNPAGRAPGRSGRGIDGMRERVTLLGGDFDAGPAGGEWHVSLRLRLRP
ncbi:sensor histidine kinase [Streptosporangium sp. NPDC000095]|uniref:sensor histidine kinase n=1 Tax=Streptosporangium sp. NPDC000095 TaxID=3366184 RepID=UPI00368BE2E7